MARLLIVHHSPTPGVRRLADAVTAGSRHPEITGVEVLVREALAASADEVAAADGILLGTTANFGYMSGALKHFFDTIFLTAGGQLGADGAPAVGTTRRTPYGLWVHGRYDTTGAVRSVMSIVAALNWKQSAETCEFLGDVTDDDLERAFDLGGSIAAMLSEHASEA